jgi:SpoVK/Ycf46/Vps4 family AAA+-type ATPase
MDAQPEQTGLYECEYDAHAALWLTKLCLSSGKHLRQLTFSDYGEDVRELIGITLPETTQPQKLMLTELKKRLADFKACPPTRKSELFTNTRFLAKLMQLNDVERGVIEFVALSTHHRVMRIMLDNISLNRVADLVAMLAAALDCSIQSVHAALDRKSTLMRANLLQTETNRFDAGFKLVITEQLSEVLHTRNRNLKQFVQRFIEQAAPPTLTVKDYPHLADELQLLEEYLTNATECGTKGVNILIYGVPGVGKTELVRLLAKRIGTPLYQVKSSDDNLGSISGSTRLLSFSLGQRFLRETFALVLFDEMEDVFPVSGFITGMEQILRSSRLSKAWINELLETNPVPTIWISNAVEHIDPAYLRRFDFSVEIGVPPIRVRKRIIKKHMQGTGVSKAAISKYAQQDEISPAQVEKAAKVLRLIDDGSDLNSAFESVLDNSMALLQQTVTRTNLDIHGSSYQLDFLNANCDLHRLVNQLKKAKRLRGAMCFYGAPGTGKSALAHYIAKITGRPLLARRASDILSPYVGVAEQKIAAMFKRAEQEESILLLDEADSFLADRKGARASWEVSQVNEMLTQMESFEGLFICSTNLMTRLDEASLRRFALKVKFNYLKPEQRWQLFGEHIGRHEQADEAHCRTVLNQLNNLTPGDFACIRRQAKLMNEKLTAEEWLVRLKQECSAKPDQGSRSIGFM